MQIKDKKDSLVHFAELSQLFDLYGGLLTDKKRQVMELYHEENLSLAEIAEELNVSRAAVHDSLKSAEKSLRAYESKLKLLADYQERNAALETIKVELLKIKGNEDAVRRITKIIEQLEA